VLTLGPPARNGPLSPTAKPATISDLTVEGGQGGVHVVTEGTSSDITNVEVTNNSSLGGIGIEDPENSGGCACPNPPLGPATHIANDYVHDNGGNQPGLWAEFADTTIVTGSEFAHNGGSGVTFGSGGPFQLLDSYSHDNTYAGFVASNTDGVSGTVLAMRDRIVNNGGGVNTNDPLLLAGDLITGSTSQPALALTQGQDDVSIADSTIAGNSAGGITEEFPRDFHYPIRLENTILGGNGGPDVEAGIPLCRVDGSMIGSLPAFTNDGTYHLAFNSTAIDAGVNARVPAQLATDIDSDRRIQGTAVDIGYDETTGTGAATPAGNAFGACQPKYQDSARGPTIAGSSVSTLTTNTTATATDPLETTVTSPTSVSTGYVTIQELLDFSNPTLTGWTDAVTAFPSGTAADPYSIEFILDKSIVTSGLTTNVFFQGVAVPACTGAPSAVPDPCVTDVHTASGDVHATVLSSDPNGIWQFTQS
jgi:hypothetical protein